MRDLAEDNRKDRESRAGQEFREMMDKHKKRLAEQETKRWDDEASKLAKA